MGQVPVTLWNFNIATEHVPLVAGLPSGNPTSQWKMRIFRLKPPFRGDFPPCLTRCRCSVVSSEGHGRRRRGGANRRLGGYEPATRDTWRHNMGRFATWKWVKNGKKISDDTSNWCESSNVRGSSCIVTKDCKRRCRSRSWMPFF